MEKILQQLVFLKKYGKRGNKRDGFKKSTISIYFRFNKTLKRRCQALSGACLYSTYSEIIFGQAAYSPQIIGTFSLSEKDITVLKTFSKIFVYSSFQ